MSNAIKIVIVDDEISLGKICQELLSIHGYTAKLYSNPQDVLAEHQHPSMDLLITDVGLGEYSGIELAQEINKRLKSLQMAEVPVILISGAILPTMNQGNFYYLEKPFSIAALLKQVQSIFPLGDKKAG